jgi:hypothetical protein
MIANLKVGSVFRKSLNHCKKSMNVTLNHNEWFKRDVLSFLAVVIYQITESMYK